jgi:probable addiction module antidote protein
MKSIPFEGWFYKGLGDPVEATAYLNAALEDEDPRIFLLALRDVTLAQGGIGALAGKTGLHRVNLNRILSAKGNPEVKSLASVMRELGFRLRVEPDTRAVKPSLANHGGKRKATVARRTGGKVPA